VYVKRAWPWELNLPNPRKMARSEQGNGNGNWKRATDLVIRENDRAGYQESRFPLGPHSYLRPF
jgi:hypothetical protein